MMISNQDPTNSERGQVLVLVAAGLLAFMGMVALVVDGGHAWGQQRATQNGTDAAAYAGAVALSENRPAAYAGNPLPNTDAEILARITQTAGQNGIVFDVAYYTDFQGDRLPGPVRVGALGAAEPPPGALGVEAAAHRDFDTFLARVLDADAWTTNASATARTGPIAVAGAGTVIPVAFPVTITGCDGTNKPLAEANGTQWQLGVTYIVPLCSGAPGSVGWLDWTPTGGGVPELITAIKTPSNPPLTIPEWHYVTETGNMSDPNIENALARYAVPPLPQANAPAGTTVFVPLFDTTCKDRPSGTGGNRPCDHGSMVGAKGWYHFYDWASFEIDWINLNGGSSLCSQSALIPGATGNGATGCFKGRFVAYNGPGTLGAPTGSETAFTPWGVELVK